MERGFSNWEKLHEEDYKEFKPDWKKNKRKNEPVNINRRKFLVTSVYGALGVASLVAMGRLDDAIDFFSQDKELEEKKDEELEIKQPKTKKPEDVSDALEPDGIKQENQLDKSREKHYAPEKIAQEILRAYNIPAVARRFDQDVFTKDFFMAQQFQESRGNQAAESNAGARGVYQNRPESVMGVVRYLAFLRRETGGFPAGERCDYAGPDNVSREEADKISALFLEKSDFGRATGKLFLLSMHDEATAYNNPPNPDVFRSKSPEEQQKLLLLAYHDGPVCRLHPEDASENGKDYVAFVRQHMDKIADLRNRLQQAEMSRDLDYSILKILQELDRKENQAKDEEVINHWLKKLQEAHMAMWAKNDNFGQPLKNNEIRKIFAQK